MTLRITANTTRRTHAVLVPDGPGPFCMTDTQAAYAVERAREAALLRAPLPDPDRRPRNMARDSLARLAEAGDITPHEYRAGREIGIGFYVMTRCARGREVAGYAERMDGRAGGSVEAYLDRERRYRDWHDWAKRQPIRPRHPASLVDLTLLVCADGWGVYELTRRYGGRMATALERLRTSLSVYCLRAGWSARITSRVVCAQAA
jgi:hypothetical protein